MKNKKILFGLIGVGALAGLYFWNKNKKSGTNVVADATSTTNPVFSTEVTDKLAKQYADEYVTELDKEINYLTLNPTNSFFSLEDSKRRISGFQKQKNNYGDIYLMFKKSIPNFKNTDDLNTAKNVLIKGLISRSTPLSKDEQIWIANNKNLGDAYGFDISIINPKENPKFLSDASISAKTPASIFSSGLLFEATKI